MGGIKCGAAVPRYTDPMAPPASPAAAFDTAAGPLLGLLDRRQAEAVLSFVPDPELVNRIELLSGKANEGTLTDAERAELLAYADADSFVSVWQAHARRRLKAAG